MGTSAASREYGQRNAIARSPLGQPRPGRSPSPAKPRKPPVPTATATAVVAPRQPGVGSVVGGYVLERLVGRGGMGAVYAARHRATGTRMAVKILSRHLHDNATSVARFRREARVASQLRSRHAVPVLASGVDDSGVCYMVMELLEGKSLSELAQSNPRMPVDLAVELIAQACDAVGEAHELGIVHRDLKLANLFSVASSGGSPMLKVLDFGIAKPQRGLVDEEAFTASSLTTAGQVVGTPHYMAPEQLTVDALVGATADVWSLGVCLYRLLTGAVPFDGDHILGIYARVLSRCFDAPRALRAEIPVAIERIILRCLDTKPSARFSNGRALGEALRAAQGASAQKDQSPPDLFEAKTTRWIPRAPAPVLYLVAPPPPVAAVPTVQLNERTFVMPQRPSYPSYSPHSSSPHFATPIPRSSQRTVPSARKRQERVPRWEIFALVIGVAMTFALALAAYVPTGSSTGVQSTQLQSHT